MAFTHVIPVPKNDYINIMLPTFGWLLRKTYLPVMRARCTVNIRLITSLEKGEISYELLTMRLSFKDYNHRGSIWFIQNLPLRNT